MAVAALIACRRAANHGMAPGGACREGHRLDAIERAIRNALDKGNADDPAFRERVYEQAYAALERALKAHPETTVESAIQRKRVLAARMTEIEAEFTAPDPDAVAAPAEETGEGFAPEVAPDVDHVAERADAPAVTLDERTADDELGPMPELERLPDGMYAPHSLPVEVAPDPNPKRARRSRRPFAIAFVLATLVAAAGMAGWGALQLGMFKTAAQRDTTVPNPPLTVEDEDFSPDEDENPSTPPPLNSEATADRNWIDVFTPADPTLVSAPAGATAEVMQDESGSFLRIRSGSSGAAVLFDVGQGILEQASGKKALFDIIARAEEGQETEITVDCNFGELGDCGRKRYLIGYERGEYLFEVGMPARDPGAGGTIAINSDFSNEGKSVDIYQIRVSISQ